MWARSEPLFPCPWPPDDGFILGQHHRIIWCNAAFIAWPTIRTVRFGNDPIPRHFDVLTTS